MEEKVKEMIELFREALKTHGGDVELVAVEGKTVKLFLRGACGTCPHAAETLKNYIEEGLKSNIDPEIVVERVEKPE